VRYYVLAMLLLSGCAWRQKDFKDELNKPLNVEPQVEVDSELLEKFEVKPVEEAKREEPEALEEKKPQEVVPKKEKTRKAPAKKAPPVKVIKKAPKKEEPKITKPVLPADYPPELMSVNAKAKKIWDLYEPNHHVDDKVYLNIYYLGMTVGKIMFTNKGKQMMNEKEVWHFHARFKSAPFYSNIYELDDTVDTFVTTDKFLSQRYSLIQRESKQDIDDLQLHDREQLKTFWFYKRKTEDSEKTKNKETYIPYHSLDPFSVLFFYQGLPLKDGDIYEIPLINKDKILILKSVVEGRETIKTEMGRKKAIRIHATTKYTGEHLKSGDLYFWFSDDERRTLLKVRAKIKIGSVTAEIVEN
jgi:hypothetical protein